jgi:hypothetical protein
MSGLLFSTVDFSPLSIVNSAQGVLMQRKIIFVLVLVIILSSCLPSQTTTPSPVIGRGTPEGQGEGIPATTTPEVTATSAPSSTPESGTAIVSILTELDYDAADHESFAAANYKIETSEWQRQQAQMLIHTNPTDKLERVDGMEVTINGEKQWVRGLWYETPAYPGTGGIVLDIMVHPLQNERAQFSDPEKGPNAVYGEYLKAIACQLGITLEQMPKYLVEHDYKVKIYLPEALNPGSKASPSLLKASDQPVEIDLSKPWIYVARAEPYLNADLEDRAEIPENAKFLWGDSRAREASFVIDKKLYLVETFSEIVASRRDYVESINLWEFFELIAHMQSGYSDTSGGKGLIQWFIDTPFGSSQFILDSTIFLNPNSNNTSFEPTVLDFK